jgi:hypothetical protein
MSQSTCNILENGVDVEPVDRERISDILGRFIEEGHGLTGFGKPSFSNG